MDPRIFILSHPPPRIFLQSAQRPSFLRKGFVSLKRGLSSNLSSEWLIDWLEFVIVICHLLCVLSFLSTPSMYLDGVDLVKMRLELPRLNGLIVFLLSYLHLISFDWKYAEEVFGTDKNKQEHFDDITISGREWMCVMCFDEEKWNCDDFENWWIEWSRSAATSNTMRPKQSFIFTEPYRALSHLIGWKKCSDFSIFFFQLPDGNRKRRSTILMIGQIANWKRIVTEDWLKACETKTKQINIRNIRIF